LDVDVAVADELTHLGRLVRLLPLLEGDRPVEVDDEVLAGQAGVLLLGLDAAVELGRLAVEEHALVPVDGECRRLVQPSCPGSWWCSPSAWRRRRGPRPCSPPGRCSPPAPGRRACPCAAGPGHPRPPGGCPGACRSSSACRPRPPSPSPPAWPGPGAPSPRP